MNIEYTAQIWKEGDQYIAHTMPLDVAPTPKRARNALDEATRLFIETASEMGTLETVLQECGYNCQDGLWKQQLRR